MKKAKPLGQAAGERAHTGTPVGKPVNNVGPVLYDADGFINWQGDLFVGGLTSKELAHFRDTVLREL